MSKRGYLFLILAALSLAIWLVQGCGGTGGGPAPGQAASSVTASNQERLVRRIVVFDKAVNEPARRALVRRFGGVQLKPLRMIDGAVVLLPPRNVHVLARRGEVVRVEVDARIRALPKPPWAGGGKPKGEQPPETLPWGVNRIDAEYAWAAGYAGASAQVAVIDTGIDRDHPDLADNVAGGVNFVTKSPRKPANPDKWDDDNGHGTHVAGIIAAVDNEIGVVGVAPAASLWAVKVLDRNGAGYVSDLIAGLQWCVDHGMQVVNMSLGTDSDVQSLHEACDAARQAGLWLVAAAGNDSAAVDYPAAYSSVIAVGAVDSSDSRPAWSSYGPEIELAAPGVGILSTWKGGSYKTLDGTSMACPHVSGTLALNLAADLAGTADDLPPAGKDPYTGYGLVDAEEAATGQATGDDLPGTVS